MILQSSYTNHFSKHLRALEMFCAVDSSVALEIFEGNSQHLYDQLIAKMTLLVSAHGLSAATEFVRSVEEADQHTVCKVITDYLEGGDRFNVEGTRELQQEILHFSRIVDLDYLSKSLSGNATPTHKRLSKSIYIPTEIKVLLELLTVVNERLLSNKKDLEDAPLPNIGEITNFELAEVTITKPSSKSCFALAIGHAKRRTRRELAYFFRNLMSYVGPRSALQVILFMLGSKKQLGEYTFDLITTVNDDWVSLSVEGGNCDGSPQDLIPAKKPLAEITWGELAEVGGELKIKTESGTFFLSKRSKVTTSANDLFEMVRTSKSYNFEEPIRSIESGHLHLDRSPSVDQMIGIEIGKLIHDHIIKIQKHPPILTPMYDDDHVLVRTTPREYQKLFEHYHGASTLRMIPESSPIVRSIVVALYNHVIKAKYQAATYLGGKNLYLRTPMSTVVELFEDFNLKCVTGCVLFETALLVYRSSPDEYDALFSGTLDLDPKESVHKQIDLIWSGPGDHNSKAEILENYYETFCTLTNPHAPNLSYCDAVMEICNDNPSTHLNVLEDYYEVQQKKVRELLELFRLPIKLRSFHFNRMTGRFLVV
jgi:hypothetical protein